MLESKLQSKVIAKYELLGYYVIKLEKTNKNGIPDLLCIKNGECFFIEVKQKGKKPRPLQLYRIDELQKFNTNTLIIDEI